MVLCLCYLFSPLVSPLVSLSRWFCLCYLFSLLVSLSRWFYVCVTSYLLWSVSPDDSMFVSPLLSGLSLQMVICVTSLLWSLSPDGSMFMCRLCNIFSPSRAQLLVHCSQLHPQHRPTGDIILALQPLAVPERAQAGPEEAQAGPEGAQTGPEEPPTG